MLPQRLDNPVLEAELKILREWRDAINDPQKIEEINQRVRQLESDDKKE